MDMLVANTAMHDLSHISQSVVTDFVLSVILFDDCFRNHTRSHVCKMLGHCPDGLENMSSKSDAV